MNAQIHDSTNDCHKPIGVYLCCRDKGHEGDCLPGIEAPAALGLKRYMTPEDSFGDRTMLGPDGWRTEIDGPFYLASEVDARDALLASRGKPVATEGHEHLYKFYQVDNDTALVKIMEGQIEALQERIRKAEPQRDFFPRKVREG